MQFSKSSLLEILYHPLRVGKEIGQSLHMLSPDCLRVLIFHDVAPYDYCRFEEQMRWLSRSWKFVTPAQFSALAAGSEPIKGRNLLITFDDGFASNREIAEKVLNPMSIQAIFFVVSDFIAMEDEAIAKKFIADNICLGVYADPLPAHWKNMSWNDLEALLEQGHIIGGHTKSHARLSDIVDPKILQDEIVRSADIVSGKLGTPVDHFAYTFGDLNSISKPALEIAKKRFRFVFSGIRGNNDGGSDCIYRDAAATQDEMLNYFIYPNRLLGSFLEGVADFHYKTKRKELQSWFGV